MVDWGGGGGVLCVEIFEHQRCLNSAGSLAWSGDYLKWKSPAQMEWRFEPLLPDEEMPKRGAREPGAHTPRTWNSLLGLRQASNT